MADCAACDPAALVAELRAHASDADSGPTAKCARALVVLLMRDTSGQQSAAAAAAGGLPAALAALRTHPSCLELIIPCLLILAEVANCSAAASASARDAGAVEVALAALQAHGVANDLVAFAACRALLDCRAAGPTEEECADRRVSDRYAPAVEPAVAALRTHVAKDDAAPLACQLVAALAAMRTDFARRLAAAGAVAALVAAMARHPGREDVQKYGAVALGRLYVKLPAAAADADASGALRACLDALRALRGSLDVAIPCCQTLSLLPASLVPRIGALAGVEAVVAAMQAHPQEVEVRCSGAMLLRTLCADGGVVGGVCVEHRRRAVRAGAVALLVRSAKELPLPLHELVCTSLACVCDSMDAAAAEAAAGAGAFEAMVACMRAAPRAAATQQACCCVITAVSMPTRPLRLRAARAGALEAITEALRAHSSDEGVSYDACTALSSLIGEVPENKTRAGAAAVRALAAALRVQASARMQVLGWSALSSLCLDVPQNAAAAVPALPVLIAALRAHGTSATLAQAGCNVIAHVTLGNAERRAAALAAGAMDAVLAAMRAHAGDEQAQNSAVGALMSLLEQPSTHAAAVARGGVALLVAAMRAHPGAVKLQRHGGTCLGTLCLYDHSGAAATAAVDAGAIEAVLTAMRAHSADAQVPIACLFALRLVITTPAAAARAGDAAVRAVLAAHRTQTFTAIVAASAMHTLATLVSHRAAAAHAAVAHGALPLLIDALSCDAFAAEHDLHTHGCATLQALADAGEAPALAAVRAGALELWPAPRTPRAELMRQRLHACLHAAAHTHDNDAAQCGDAECRRCAELRARGELCALPGCGARSRDGGAKRLLRCGTCRAACYCGAAHQREDWRRHRGGCAAAAAAPNLAGGDDA
jgi:hypothetical protein